MDEPQIKKQITKKNRDSFLFTSIFIAALIIVLVWIYATGLKPNTGEQRKENTTQATELPVVWGNLGAQMVAAGVINRTRLETLYVERVGFTDNEKQLLEENNGKMIITQENSGFILNLFWALGLSNKNKILEEGPMADSRYGHPGQFASTGGWTIAKGNAMNHYGKYSFITLTPEQQAIVERVSRNIYRPCCDNSTYFPDCNHGMAMLGLLELLASQGASENQMYEAALQMNIFWFSEQYATIARHLASKGQTFSSVDPKEILGSEYSSASGFRRISTLIPSGERQRGGSCGV